MLWTRLRMYWFVSFIECTSVVIWGSDDDEVDGGGDDNGVDDDNSY